jgi:hypothetical protein
MKRSKKNDFESAGIELIKSRIDKRREADKDKDEGNIFSELIGTQLKKMPLHDRLMAKMEINQTIYKFMMKNAPEYNYSSVENPLVTMAPISQSQQPFMMTSPAYQPCLPMRAMIPPLETLRMTSTPVTQFQQSTRLNMGTSHWSRSLHR